MFEVSGGHSANGRMTVLILVRSASTARLPPWGHVFLPAFFHSAVRVTSAPENVRRTLVWELSLRRLAHSDG